MYKLDEQLNNTIRVGGSNQIDLLVSTKIQNKMFKDIYLKLYDETYEFVIDQLKEDLR